MKTRKEHDGMKTRKRHDGMKTRKEHDGMKTIEELREERDALKKELTRVTLEREVAELKRLKLEQYLCPPNTDATPYTWRLRGSPTVRVIWPHQTWC